MEGANDLVKKRQPVSGRGRICTQLCVTPSEELLIRFEGGTDTLRDTLAPLPKAQDLV